jgi:hypothetical protein
MAPPDVTLMAPLALMLIVTIAFSAEAITGFGSTVLTVAMGAHLLPLAVLLPVYVPVNLVLSAWLVARHRRHVDRALLFRGMLPLVGAGMVAGLLLYRLQPGKNLLIGFGAFVALLASVELWRIARRTPVSPPGRWHTRLALIAGGVVHGVYGSGGPLIVYATARSVTDKSVFRVTLSALWLVLGVVLIVHFAVLGLLNASTLWTSASLLPPLVLALLIGERLHHRVPEAPFRVLVYALLLVAATSLLWRTLNEVPS